MLLIGSRAAKIHYPEFRQPKDYDFIATSKEVDSFLSKFSFVDTSKHEKKRRARASVRGAKLNFEFDLVEHHESSKLIYKKDWGHWHQDNYLGVIYQVANPFTLLLLKKSHIIFNIHWDKNINDYLFLKEKVKKFPSWWNEVLRLRFKEVKTRINKKQFNFNVDNSEFFRKSEKFINRVIEHDALHYATCFYDKPLFLLAKEDLSKAELSKEKVRQMSHLQKIQMIQEECMALSLERHIIPCLQNKQPYDADVAYRKVAGQMVYNYLPMFLRYFAADHFNEILNLKVNYVQKFLNNPISKVVFQP